MLTGILLGTGSADFFEIGLLHDLFHRRLICQRLVGRPSGADFSSLGDRLFCQLLAVDLRSLMFSCVCCVCSFHVFSLYFLVFMCLLLICVRSFFTSRYVLCKWSLCNNYEEASVPPLAISSEHTTKSTISIDPWHFQSTLDQPKLSQETSFVYLEPPRTRLYFIGRVVLWYDEWHCGGSLSRVCIERKREEVSV